MLTVTQAKLEREMNDKLTLNSIAEAIKLESEEEGKSSGAAAADLVRSQDKVCNTQSNAYQE